MARKPARRQADGQLPLELVSTEWGNGTWGSISRSVVPMWRSTLYAPRELFEPPAGVRTTPGPDNWQIQPPRFGPNYATWREQMDEYNAYSREQVLLRAPASRPSVLRTSREVREQMMNTFEYHLRVWDTGAFGPWMSPPEDRPSPRQDETTPGGAVQTP